MKILKIIIILSALICFTVPTYGQESNTAPERTPEHEAVFQTEKLQSELRLSHQQAKQVHEINLKYARERQNLNSRSAALQRLKKKYDELKQVLSSDQYLKLQNKQYERSSFQSTEPSRTSTPSTRSANEIQPNVNSRSTYKTAKEPNSRIEETPTRRDDSGVNEQNTPRTSSSARPSASPASSSGSRTTPNVGTGNNESRNSGAREGSSAPRTSTPARSSGNTSSSRR